MFASMVEIHSTPSFRSKNIRVDEPCSVSRLIFYLLERVTESSQGGEGWVETPVPNPLVVYELYLV